MGLEAGTYISDLVVTNPVGATDERRFGDDHLRLIKSVLKNTFPDANAPMRFLRFEAAPRTVDTILAHDDKGKYLYASGLASQSFTAPGLLGNGWWCIYRNTGPSRMILNTAINGINPLSLYPGEEVLIATNGFEYLGFGLNGRVLLETKTQPFTGQIAAEFTNISTARFKSYLMQWENLVPTLDGMESWIQVSTDNGATWVTSATYQWTRMMANGVTVAASAHYSDTRLTLAADYTNEATSSGGKAEWWPTQGRVRWDVENTPNNSVHAMWQGWGAVTGGANAIRLLFSSGGVRDDTSGLVRLYGLI